MSDLPPTDAHAAAVEEEIEWEEEEEEEVVEVAGGGGGAVEPAAQPEAAEPTPAAPAAPAAPAPPSRAELVAHLHHLMRPFGPLEFSLATTLEPSIVPQPPRSLYPGCESGGGGGSRKRNADHSNPHEPTMSAEAFYHAVRDLKALPLVRVGRHDAAPMYEPHLIAQSIQPDAARQESTTDAAFSDIHTLGHVKAVDRFFDLAAGGSAVEYGSALHRRLFLQHEWFDPYRLLTHAPPTDAPPKPHPGDAVAEEARYEAFRQEAGTSTVPLNVSRSLSFLSSHLALSLAELDMLHSLLTSPAQRSREGVAHAATHPPPPKDMFQTFVDLSGGEGAAAEYILWKRRVVNLRAKGWAYDLTASPAKQNWSVQWRNATAREQSKNFDVFHPPHDPTASSSAIADQLRSEQNIDTFQRMIDMQTRGVGVNLAIAANYAPDAASRVVHAASLSYRPNAHTLYPTLLFQVDTALRTLAQGGHLLLQLYETHTPFTLSVIYILFQLFDHCILQQLAGTVGYGSGQWSVAPDETAGATEAKPAWTTRVGSHTSLSTHCSSSSVCVLAASFCARTFVTIASRCVRPPSPSSHPSDR